VSSLAYAHAAGADKCWKSAAVIAEAGLGCPGLGDGIGLEKITGSIRLWGTRS